MRISTLERFEQKFIAEPNTGCFLWIGTLWGRDLETGSFWIGGRIEIASRASWMIYRGAIPAGLWVLHTCDNRLCVNHRHLYLGTHADNTRDAVERKRFARGDAHHDAKLSREQVIQIRSGMSCKDAQRAFGISHPTFYRVRARQYYRDY